MQGKTDDVMKYRFTLNTGDQFDCSAFEEEDGLGVTLYQAITAKNLCFGHSSTARPVVVVVRMGYYYREIDEYESEYLVKLETEVDRLESPRPA